MEKNNDTKDYSEQLEFLNSEPYYASKKIVNQSSDIPVRRTGSYRHKKSTGTLQRIYFIICRLILAQFQLLCHHLRRLIDYLVPALTNRSTVLPVVDVVKL